MNNYSLEKKLGHLSHLGLLKNPPYGPIQFWRGCVIYWSAPKSGLGPRKKADSVHAKVGIRSTRKCWLGSLRNSVGQCRIFEYIRIYLDKYIHLSEYSSIFSKANIFGYSFVIYSCCWIYSDIHWSNIYDSEYIWIFIVFQKWFKKIYYWCKWFNMGPK